MQVLLAGYMIPGMGPRSASVALIVSDLQLDAAMQRAQIYIDKTGFKCLVFDIQPFEDFSKEPAKYLKTLREQALQAWLLEYPDEVAEEQHIEDDTY